MASRYVRTGTVLDKILVTKVEEIAARQATIGINTIRSRAEAAPLARDMLAALQRETVALIAEVKHASPSRGVLIEDFDPVGIGIIYAENGAAAISVLTDETYFQGHLDFMTAIRNATSVPVLRKDFIIDPYQVYEARAAGADAVLLIVAALDDAQLTDLSVLTAELGMTALVEVHDEDECERALRTDPALLGINNRDLRTFNVDLQTTVRLATSIPESVTLVAESGIFTADHVKTMADVGVRAVLVGEALVTSDDIAAKVNELSSQSRQVVSS